jgi:hypothetical protein
MTTELETCDECGRDFRTEDDGIDQDEVLCPRCKDGRREDASIYAGEKMPASEAEMQDWLADLIEEAEEGDAGVAAETFHAAGVLTMNKGLVVRMPNGAEFQVTIVRSR